MSARAMERALIRLASPEALLAAGPGGAGFGVYPNGDRRVRPVARLAAAEVRELESEGVLERTARGYVLSEAGRARLRRQAAAAEERFAAQHRPVIARSVVDANGDLRPVRGFEANATLRRLAALRDASGQPWLSREELHAAATLRRDWDASAAGLVRGSDWTAPPRGASARAAANGQEEAMARRCDARRRLGEALDRLAAPLRRTVERVCLHDHGIEALERAESWPQRSGKLALKMGLAQLVVAMGERR